MDSKGNTNDAVDAGPVIGVIKMRTSASEEPGLLDEINAIFVVERASIEGFLAAQVLQSVDGKTIVIMTEWIDRHAWARSRYDMRIGRLIEHCLVKSATIEFELYVRRGEVARTRM
jgi:heme-degrading monooxygenase HmoA